MEWKIQSRSHSCQACSAAFRDGETFHTALIETRLGYERHDFCLKCWGAQSIEVSTDKNYVSHWKGVYQAPPAAPPEAIQKDTAESLLRKLMDRREDRYAAACYILAVMLERKRILRVKSQLNEKGKRVFVYEHSKDGDVFAITDPELQLAQLETVQRDVAELLERGLPVEGAPQEEPFNAPSEMKTLAPV